MYCSFILFSFLFFYYRERESLKFKQFLNEFLFSAGADAGGDGCDGGGGTGKVNDDCCSNKFIKSKFNGCTM